MLVTITPAFYDQEFVTKLIEQGHCTAMDISLDSAPHPSMTARVRVNINLTMSEQEFQRIFNRYLDKKQKE